MVLKREIAFFAIIIIFALAVSIFAYNMGQLTHLVYPPAYLHLTDILP